MLRDCRINRIIEGTTEIMQLFLAREAMDPHLKVAADLLKKHTPIGKKVTSGIKLAGFYSTWYPTQWINSSLWHNHGDMDKLAKHYSYIETNSHKLARTIFHYMGLYQDRLERKQLILASLVNIGTELFAMSATCSYAIQKIKDEPKLDQTPKYLADVFCLASRRRIEAEFERLDDNDDAKNLKLAKSVLKGDVSWLEDGVIHTP
jgi:hypothetical protein